ncbi:MAG: hypothetical protein A3H97_05690 [Acidobacteria bacterium RIFCSPLOWO2_02_FULL_65_29]|nr:MAG: hypothetical protein A3H97_05690 [Acidobacteria bacterium RIFCSPLOWO2_02_FULL_65_29]
MTILKTTTTNVLAAVLSLSVATVPASAQRAVQRDGSSQPSSGGRETSGGGRTSSGGGQSSGAGPSKGGGQSSGGGAVQRAPARDGGGSGRGPAVVTRDRGTPSGGSSGGDSGGDRTGTRSGGRDSSRQTPPYSRPRGNNRATGEAVARRGAPPSTGGRDTILVPGGYYGGYYPWGWGGVGVGGYYGGYDDPWYYGGSPVYSGSYGYDGQLRLKIAPRDAQVFVDGYFAGIVDEFDGFWQRLHIEPGPHRIEVRADGYEPLGFEIRILPGRTITYAGELRPLTP